MRDMLFDAEAAAAKSPESAAQQHMRPVLPKRFYKSVDVSADSENPNTWLILLDGKKVKTPAKSFLNLPNEPSARLIAAEWEAQVEKIDPAKMPMTRLANTAIDGIASDPQAVLEDMVRFASSDLLYYRASHPEKLVNAQQEKWDSILDKLTAETGARFETTEGIIHVPQSKEALALFSARLTKHSSPLQLACLHTITSLTGSALIAFSLAEKFIDLDEAWAAAHVDEDHNNALWGEDFEAAKRREARLSEMSASHMLFEALAE
jgi:chaperone required for assembly of F1-ATPase